MSRLVTVLGGAVILMGVLVAVSPEQWLSVVDWESRTGQYVATAIRVVSGLILILGASATRYPKGFRIVGVVLLLLGLAVLLIPLESWSTLLRWTTSWPLPVMRVGGVVASLLGAFIIYAARPEPSQD